jgi:galactitol 2-dehydrogenase
MKRLQGKTALITGAARGIGLAFAEAYISEGAQVALADIDIARARTEAERLGSGAIAIEMDVTRQSSIDAAVAQTVTEFGQIDILDQQRRHLHRRPDRRDHTRRLRALL